MQTFSIITLGVLALLAAGCGGSSSEAETTAGLRAAWKDYLAAVHAKDAGRMCDRMTSSSRKALDAIGGCEKAAATAALVQADAGPVRLRADGAVARGADGSPVGRYEDGRWRFGD